MRKSNTDFNISFLVPTSSPAVLGFFGATKIVRQAASFFAPPAIASPRTIVVQILRRKEKISDILKRDFGRGERMNERMDERASERCRMRQFCSRQTPRHGLPWDGKCHSSPACHSGGGVVGMKSENGTKTVRRRKMRPSDSSPICALRSRQA